MALTERQRQLVFSSYVESQGDSDPLVMLWNLVDFILTHTRAEVVAKMRQVVQASRGDSQAIFDSADAENTAAKAELSTFITELDDVDTELASG
jgi:hypothetical protein